MLQFATVLRKGLEAVALIGGIMDLPAMNFLLAVICGVTAGGITRYHLVYRVIPKLDIVDDR